MLYILYPAAGVAHFAINKLATRCFGLLLVFAMWPYMVEDEPGEFSVQDRPQKGWLSIHQNSQEDTVRATRKAFLGGKYSNPTLPLTLCCKMDLSRLLTRI